MPECDPHLRMPPRARFKRECSLAVPEAKLSSGIAYNVTVADVSVGVQYDIASATCMMKMGYA